MLRLHVKAEGWRKIISFINTSVWLSDPVSPLNAFRVIPGQAIIIILVRKVNIHAYSIYVLIKCLAP